MADSTRTGWSFAAGVMVGGAITLWASMAWLLPALGPALSPHVEASGLPAAGAASHLVASDTAAGGRPAADAASRAAPACGSEPLLPPTSTRDGRFTLEPAPGGEPPGMRSYLAAARDAARQGRVRDSEVALLVACRLAAAQSPRISVPVADVQSLLGQRYLEAADAQRDEAARSMLLERAEALLEQSLLAYTVVLGSDSSKSRMAARRMALLAQLREPQDRFAAAGQDVALLTPDAPALATLGAGPRPLWGGLVPPGAGESSPAWAATALIRVDPELTQLEAHLERLQAQAANVARDPAALRERSERARAQRDAQCRDKSCLVRWYAQRKRELFAEF